MFNKETEYAIRALIYIQFQNLEGRHPGIIEIAEEIHAPQFYTGKILQRLVKLGKVESQKGKGGGFFFDPDKPSLSLKEVITTTEGNKIFEGCGLGLRQCNDSTPCPLHEQYKVIRNSIEEMITNESIQSVALKIVESKEPMKNLLKL
jgi:Rrf2 family protein